MSFNRISNLRRKLALMGLDGFILGLLAMLVLAWLFPNWGSSDGPLPLKQITTIGVSLIFFAYGLKLSPEKLKAGLSNFRLHILIQSSTFLLFPAIIWLAFFAFRPGWDNLLWTGIFFLAALPSTVSSSVVMVSIAKGNIPAAIFNASISSLIGIIMTPFWMGLVLNNAGWELNPLQIFLELILKVILPVSAGIFLHPYLGKYVVKVGDQLRIFDQSIILLIVLISFSDSFKQNLYQSFKVSDLLGLALGMVLLFFAIYALNLFASRKMGFSREDQITSVFCGSKKSLVHGTVMASVLFKAHPSTGIILMPILLYHTIQLITASILAQRMAK
jgi:solute carrier family 10 (sodium/bile acid cotransporter), member 7